MNVQLAMLRPDKQQIAPPFQYALLPLNVQFTIIRLPELLQKIAPPSYECALLPMNVQFAIVGLLPSQQEIAPPFSLLYELFVSTDSLFSNEQFVMVGEELFSHRMAPPPASSTLPVSYTHLTLPTTERV